jgi:hypothetical protein
MSEEQNIDWRKILIAYMAHVGRDEGVDFLGVDEMAQADGLTTEENEALRQVANLGRLPQYQLCSTKVAV